MDFLSLPFKYIHFHYFVAPIDIFNSFRNLKWFLDKFFAPKVLIGNFFSPICFSSIFNENKNYTLNSTLKLSLIFSGILLRIFSLLLALISNILLLILFVITCVFWFILPVILIMLLKEGLVLLAI